jgi:ADP-ribose pyrophosphatase YjhB (NUDIX family)
MLPEKIRPIAICVFRYRDRILVAEGRDSRKNRVFYRPLGGTIEFGEHGDETVRRELKEEIDAEIVDVQYLGMLENIFVYEGRRGHEIVLVYTGRFAAETFYQTEVIEGNEFGHKFSAVWKSLSDFSPDRLPVYPEGLLELLHKHE